MKRFFIFLLCFTFNFFSFSKTIPDELAGIWEGKDRFVFFEQNQGSDSPEIVILLKEYYGWYYDRTAEPSSYGEKEPRTLNSGTTKNPEHINIDVNELKKDSNLYTCEIKLTYSKSEANLIPAAIIDNKMYLDFYLQNENDKNIYTGVAKSEGLKITDQLLPENINVLYVSNGKTFRLRYWKTDMDFSDETALFKLNEIEFDVPKHIISAGQNYTCVSGRSKKIRNTKETAISDDLGFISMAINGDEQGLAPIVIADKEPYLTRLADKNTFEELMKIVKQGNSRRKPDPPPLFPPDDLNWHWDLIRELEKYNPYVQEVRKHQKAFAEGKLSEK